MATYDKNKANDWYVLKQSCFVQLGRYFTARHILKSSLCLRFTGTLGRSGNSDYKADGSGNFCVNAFFCSCCARVNALLPSPPGLYFALLFMEKQVFLPNLNPSAFSGFVVLLLPLNSTSARRRAVENGNNVLWWVESLLFVWWAFAVLFLFCRLFFFDFEPSFFLFVFAGAHNAHITVYVSFPRSSEVAVAWWAEEVLYFCIASLFYVTINQWPNGYNMKTVGLNKPLSMN